MKPGQAESRRTVNLKVRLTPEELEHLRKRAEEDGSASFREAEGGQITAGTSVPIFFLKQTIKIPSC